MLPSSTPPEPGWSADASPRAPHPSQVGARTLPSSSPPEPGWSADAPLEHPTRARLERGRSPRAPHPTGVSTRTEETPRFVRAAPSWLCSPGVTDRPTFMQPSKAGEAIRAKIQAKPPFTLTVADAAAETGLALRDAESGLKWSRPSIAGQLRVTARVELVHVFPSGFSKPWERRDARGRGPRGRREGAHGRCSASSCARGWRSCSSGTRPSSSRSCSR